MSMTDKERAEMIKKLTERGREWATKPQTVSFGKTPPGGWTDKDRVK